ncbi:MAG: cytochrome B [Saprospiraceae bacterium]|nr:cytochrome B [Saprospiraceae bacterium]
MYNFFLISHSWLRWVVLIMAVYAIYKNYEGFTSGRKWLVSDKKVNTFFIASLHLQLLLGLILYFGVSPTVQTFMADVKGSMKVAELRFFGMEHFVGTVLGIVIAQVGSIRAKKQISDAGKFRTAFFWFLIATLVILIMIPFGIWNADRPMFRF